MRDGLGLNIVDLRAQRLLLNRNRKGREEGFFGTDYTDYTVF